MFLKSQRIVKISFRKFGVSGGRSKMVKIQDIAKACNVSIATVSNILNGKKGASEETRKLVLSMASKMNYRPNRVAKNLKQQTNKTIGVITEDLTIFFTPEIVDGINEYCEEKNYQLILNNLRIYKKFGPNYYTYEGYYKQVEEEFWETLSMQVEGIIYVGGHERNLYCIPNEFPKPIVVAYGFANNKVNIVINDRHGAHLATKYLIDAGHDKIGVISGEFSSYHTQSRLLGYQQALFEAGIAFDNSIIEIGNWERDSGYIAMEKLHQKGISSIFCMNDMMAAGAYDYCSDHGLMIGKDISIVGFDNREISMVLRPALTTIELPLHKIGYVAAERLIEQIEDGLTEKEDLIHFADCKLIEGESVDFQGTQFK